MIDHSALKTELDTDPNAYGYGVGPRADADLLNEIRVAITIARDTVTPQDIVSAVDPAEYEALSAAKRSTWELMMSAARGGINDLTTVNWAGVSGYVRTVFAGAGGAISRPALLALADRTGSRSEELFGAGVKVTPRDVRIARELP